jgi:EamA-like transporter family.
VHPNRVVALFVLLAALWGTAFMAIKAGLADLPPVLFAAVRYDIAGVCMLAVAAWRTSYLVRACARTSPPSASPRC